MTTPQNPEHGDKSPQAQPTANAPQPPDSEAATPEPGAAPQPTGDAPQPPDESRTNEPEPPQPSGTAWATPAAGEPWHSTAAEPAAPLPGAQPQPQPFGPGAPPPDQAAQPWSAGGSHSPGAPAQAQPWDAGAKSQPAGGQWSGSAGGPGLPPQPDPQESRYGGGHPTYSQQPYETPPRSGSQKLSIIAFVCAAISLLFCPILFGPAGIILGVIGHNKGESLGKWAAIVSGIALVVGLVLSFVVFSDDMIPEQN
jgi:hypothetical protein